MRNSPETTFIYALVNPEDGQYFYIGKTDDPHVRLRHHLNESKSGRYPRHLFIQELLARGVRPLIVVLEEVPSDSWEEHEKRHIARLRGEGLPLLNATAGGGTYPDWSGKHHSRETRDKISRANKGKPGKPLSPAHRAKLSVIAKTTPRWNTGSRGLTGKDVYQYALNGAYIRHYRSTGEAAADNRLNPSEVIRCCKGIAHRAKSFMYRYELHERGIEPYRDQNKLPVAARNAEGAIVHMFASIKDAARILSINAGNISVCVSGHGAQKTAGGYSWEAAPQERVVNV